MRRNAGTELLASWQYDILDAFLPPAWVTFIFPADEITSALYLELLQDLTWNIKQISNKESQLSPVFESSYRKINEKKNSVFIFLLKQENKGSYFVEQFPNHEHELNLKKDPIWKPLPWTFRVVNLSRRVIPSDIYSYYAPSYTLLVRKLLDCWR